MRLIDESRRNILRIFAVSRRAMLIGVISLLVSIFAMHVEFADIISVAWPVNGLYSAILLFFLVSPLLYILLLVCSTAYIRKHGQSAAYQREKLFIVSCISCMISDITSPFRAVKNFLMTMFGKAPDNYPDAYWRGSKRIYTFRLIEMLLFIALCFFGVQIILWNT